MAEKTPNLNLTLPSQSDQANVEVLNENFRKLDEHAMVHPDMAVNDPNDLRYIENRLAYKEEGTIVFFPTMTVSNVGNGDVVYVAEHLRYPLEGGKTYTVSVNGETHEIIAQTAGSTVVLDGPGNYVFFSDGENTRIRLPANTTATYGITGEGEVVKPLGSEYLTFSGRPEIEELTDGDMMPVARKDGTVALIPSGKTGGGGMPEGTAPNQMMVTDEGGVAKWEERTHYPYHTRVLILPELDYSTLDYVDNSLSWDITPYMQGQIVVGETYYLTFGDEVLECRAYAGEFGDVFLAENNDFISSRVGIIYRDGQYLLSVNDGGANPKTIKIEGLGIAYKKLDKEYLPDDIGGADWNAKEGEPGYVANRTHWIDFVDVALYADATVAVIPDEGMGFLDTPPTQFPTGGGTFNVVWNGTTYTSKGFEMQVFDALNGVFIGNAGAMGEGEDTGEPFAIIVLKEADAQAAGGMYGIVIPLDGSEAPTFSISGKGESVHPIDEKFLSTTNSFIKNGKTIGSLRGLHAREESEDYTLGTDAVALGINTAASGDGAFACGAAAEAKGYCAVAIGDNIAATGNYSAVFGSSNTASETSAFAQGNGCVARGIMSHAEGSGTIAAGYAQHVQGKHNIGYSDYAHIVGNGEDDSHRSNAHTLDWDGNAWYAGTVEGTAMILKSPNGTRYKVTVNDSGNLTATAL